MNTETSKEAYRVLTFPDHQELGELYAISEDSSLRLEPAKGEGGRFVLHNVMRGPMPEGRWTLLGYHDPLPRP